MRPRSIAHCVMATAYWPRLYEAEADGALDELADDPQAATATVTAVVTSAERIQCGFTGIEPNATTGRPSGTPAACPGRTDTTGSRASGCSGRSAVAPGLAGSPAWAGGRRHGPSR